MIKLQSPQSSHPPTSININESADCLYVWDSSEHPNNLGIKEDLREIGYLVQTLGTVYTVEGPELSTIKTAIESLYGISEDDRSGEP